MSCPLIAGNPQFGPPQMRPGQARDLGPVRKPETCQLNDFLPSVPGIMDGSPGNPKDYLGIDLSKNWIAGNYKGGSSACYQSQPQQPMFPRQGRWPGANSPLGGWWPTNPEYNGGILLKPANYCPNAFYTYDSLAPWGLKSF